MSQRFAVPDPEFPGRSPVESESTPPATGQPLTDAQLAILLRETQWTIGDMAYDLPSGRVTPQARQDLAELLETLAATVRGSAGVVVDAEV